LEARARNSVKAGGLEDGVPMTTPSRGMTTASGRWVWEGQIREIPRATIWEKVRNYADRSALGTTGMSLLGGLALLSAAWAVFWVVMAWKFWNEGE
jgi:hypothetical protein